jgi:hypothetical protein
MSTISVRQVISKSDKIAFLKVPFEIYKNDPNWVAPLFLERLEHLDPKKNPYFQHAEAQLFIAEQNGKAVGRVSAQIDQLHIERYKDATGQFGFLEAQNDPAIFAALFKSAESWLKSRGMKRALGPFSFSINDETGLLIEGFESPPNMMMGHAAAFYASHVEANGFKKCKDVLAYEYHRSSGMPKTLQRLYERGMASGDVVIRPLNKADIKNEMKIIMEIFNDAWSDNWGFVPFTDAELQMLATNLKMLVKKEAVQIATYRGENAAMMVSLPNLNEWIAGMNGSLLPFGWAKMVGKLVTKKSNSFRVPLMGVKKKFQDGLLGSALSIGLIKHVVDFYWAEGSQHCELSWILEDNKPMRHILENVGATVYKKYRVYEKKL